jgi:ATP-dependent DNA helicase RecQ
VQTQTPQQVLKKYFGYDSFRPLQEKIINTIVGRQDCLSIIPTGGGKSLCFQIPGLLLGGTTVVVSPLISLMEDQVQQLQKRGIAAVQLSSSLSTETRKNVEAQIVTSNVDFVYLSPEQLQSKKWQTLCQKINISLVVIDEAHCISQWGHDFRLPYRQISTWMTSLKYRPTIAAFTATATPKTATDITNSLQMNNSILFKQDALPEHLHWIVHDCPDSFHKWLRLFQLLKKHNNQAGIIYTLTRSATEEIASIISDFIPNLKVGFYHGGMSSEERQFVQQQFIDNQLHVIVATNAFGMGVDKPNIRFVIHFHTPNSIEAYVQEVGRAGRDRKESWCYVLQQISNQKINTALVGTDLRKQQKYRLLMKIISKKSCLKASIASYFSINHDTICGTCSKCSSYKTIEKVSFNRLLQSIKVRHNKTAPLLTQKQLALLTVLAPLTIQQIRKLPGFGQGWEEKSLPLLRNDKIYRSLIKTSER